MMSIVIIPGFAKRLYWLIEILDENLITHSLCKVFSAGISALASSPYFEYGPISSGESMERRLQKRLRPTGKTQTNNSVLCNSLLSLLI